MKKVIILAAGAMLALVSCQQKTEELTLSGLDPQNFNTTVDGKDVALYKLTNQNGLEACITNYGGRVVSLMVPDAKGNFQDVVLGHDSIADYINIDGNFGALIGRYGNRIDQGRFSIDGTEYQLPQNNYGHCLHGGDTGFHHAVWNVGGSTDSTLTLTLSSPDGDAGFPGNIEVKVVYTLTADNALDIAYSATTDAPTILNLTNHSYFNLSGNPSQPVTDHVVWFDAAGYTPIDSTFMTTGEIAPVEGTPFDFNTPKAIGRDIDADDQQLANGHGYDHNIVSDSLRDTAAPWASVYCPETGIKMEVISPEPGIQFYTGNFLDGTVTGKKGIVYPHRGALCLETQHFPDSPNKAQWPSVVVRPGETYTSNCQYRFSVVEPTAAQ